MVVPISVPGMYPMETPLGIMAAGATASGIWLLDYPDSPSLEKRCRRPPEDIPVCNAREMLLLLQNELRAYFKRELQRFSVPLHLAGTPFQSSVWRSVLEIPYGATLSYAELAERSGCPSAVRAVAAAVGANRLALLIPCHRVIGAGGRLTGYTGGLHRKRRLLEHEQGKLRLPL